MDMVGKRLIVIAFVAIGYINSYAHAGHINRFPASLTSSEPKALEGQWNLVLNAFLTYDDIKQDTTAIALSVPGTWNNAEWYGKTFSGQGFGTYYKTVIRDKDLISQPLALHISDLSLAYELFINNKRIGGIGKVGTTKSSNQPKIQPRIYDLPEELGDEFTIIIHVANFRHHNSGLWQAPIIGPEETLRHDHIKNSYFTLLILGGVLLIGAYHLYLFFRRRAEQYGIFFFAICTTLSINTLTKGDIPLLDIFPDLGWVALKKLQYISLIMIALFNVLFVQSLYTYLVSKLLVKILVVITTLSVAFTLFASPALSFILIVPFQFITIGSAIYIIYVLAVAAWQRQTSALLLLVGMMITFLTLVNDVLVVHFVISTVPIAHFGVFVYVIAFSIAIANRFTNAMKHEETLSKSLETVNQELEEKVHLRTAEIEWQQRIVDKQNKELKAVNEEQKQLMAVVAHDLKSPLNKISGLAGIMKSELTGEMANMLGLIDKVSTEGKVIIENLTNLWAYEKEEHKIEWVKLDLDQFLTETATSFDQEAIAKGIKLETNFQTKGKKIRTDANSLQRILDNIISNAIKFSDNGMRIWISSTINSKQLQISIKDEGPGFTKGDLKKVFGKFQKLSARPTGNESSTGLGLSIVKTLVEKIKGEIVLNSQAGKGAEFVISLPLKNATPKKVRLKKA